MTPWERWNHELVSRRRTQPASTQRRALAELTARHGIARLLNADNTSTRTISLDAAIEQDLSFFVVVNPMIIAMDFDSSDASRRALDVHAALLVAGFAPVLCASGGGGRRHIFCRMSRDDAERVLGSVQEPASSLIKTSIRPPLALHRTGKARSTLLVPEDPEEAARRLAIDSPVRPIKHRARWGAFEAAQAEDPDASSAICAVARGGANAGWSFEDFMTVISSPATPVSTLLASRISREGWRRSRSWARKAVWDDAVDLIKEHPPTGEPDAEVIAQLGWALDRQWAGATGRSDFVVYLALLRKQAMCGRTEFDLSVREIAEFAGLGSINTVRSSLARLVGAGLVARIAEGSRGLVTRRSATWRLTPQEASLDLTPAGFAEVMAAISHEVFWNKIALNKGSAMLYVQLLVRGMLTTADLVDLTGWSPRVTRERLADMAHSGVVVEVGEEWSATTLFELDIAAKDFGVDGRGAAQRQAHDRQRIGSDIRSG